jgi:glutathione S-transferase
MLIVHHLGISQSERIIWLCEELAIPYQLIRYDRDAKTKLAPPEYKALHPMGVAPVIQDGDKILAESGAIMEYIIAKHGNGRLALKPDHPNFADYLFWFHFANATMMPSDMLPLIARVLGVSTEGPTAQALMARGDRAYALVETHLATHPYFAGTEFTAADMIMLFPLTTFRAFAPRDLSAYPHILAYLQRIGARPAYQTAMAKGDPGFTPMLT